MPESARSIDERLRKIGPDTARMFEEFMGKMFNPPTPTANLDSVKEEEQNCEIDEGRDCGFKEVQVAYSDKAYYDFHWHSFVISK